MKPLSPDNEDLRGERLKDADVFITCSVELYFNYENLYL